jgi:transposase
MPPKDYFLQPSSVPQRQYEALRAFFVEGYSASQAAQRFHYSLSAFYSLIRDFKSTRTLPNQDPFFTTKKAGRIPKDVTGELQGLIISLRKKYLSVPDITSTLEALGYRLSEKYVYNVLTEDGFERLPRRKVQAKQQACSTVKWEAPKADVLHFTPEQFTSQNTLGALCLLPYLHQYGLVKLLQTSAYPESKALNKVASILSFVALKLSNARRYTADDAWCMDRGLGLFAGLNVLPKAAWFSSYSHRVTREMNLAFLKRLNSLWHQHNLLSETANLDFTTLPYWGDDSHLENNWSATRHKGLASLLAVIGQDQDSGILTYGDTTTRHEGEMDVALQFLDFSKKNGHGDLRYLVFDSRFTTYETLAKLDNDVKFITIRRRGKNIVDQVEKLPGSEWKTVRVMKADGKGRILRVHDSRVVLRGYGKQIRQIALTGHGKVKPALIITNDFEKPLQDIIRIYARRWLVEKTISEQVEFFHLNSVSSSMVIKVDFDLTMSIFTHNLLRLLALDLPGYSHFTAQSLFDHFLNTSGSVDISAEKITVRLKKKRNLPAILTAMTPFQPMPLSLLGDRALYFEGETRS